MAPRAVLISTTPCFIFAILSRVIIPRVSSFKSRWSETTSLVASTVSRSVNSTPGWLLGDRFQAITFMPLPCAMRATSAAMPPKPTRPSVLPVSCMPSSRSQLPARISRSICAITRADDHISAIADSATAVSP